MIALADWHKLELNHTEHYKDLLREADRARLVREALARRERRCDAFARVMTWLGHCLLAWGQWLEQRFAADRPIQSFPVVHRPR